MQHRGLAGSGMCFDPGRDPLDQNFRNSNMSDAKSTGTIKWDIAIEAMTIKLEGWVVRHLKLFPMSSAKWYSEVTWDVRTTEIVVRHIGYWT